MCTTQFPLRRLALAAALALTFTSLAGAASDTTTIEVRAAGKVENIVLDDMKIGESRQLYSEAGTLVTALRTADALELDIAGEKTRIALHDPLSGDAIAAIVADADGSEGTRIIRVKRADSDTHGGAGTRIETTRNIVLVSNDGSSVHTLGGDEDLDVLLDDVVGGADGEVRHLVVKRRVVEDGKADTDDSSK